MQRLVELSKQYLPHLSCGLSDSRVQLHIDDGAEFVTEHKQKFDVIITDPSDYFGKDRERVREKERVKKKKSENSG